jgi:hypothetical protein
LIWESVNLNTAIWEAIAATGWRWSGGGKTRRPGGVNPAPTKAGMIEPRWAVGLVGEWAKSELVGEEAGLGCGDGGFAAGYADYAEDG